MDHWQAVLTLALVGTAHQMPQFQASSDAFAPLLSQLDTTEREVAVLHAVALLTAWRKAGRLVTVDDVALADPAPVDALPPCNARAANQLATMLAGQHGAVLGEWLDLVAGAHQRVSPQHLPALLDYGVRHKALRASIVRVLGARGRWLAAQNGEWAYVVNEGDASVWEHGSRPARLAYFERLRMTDPTQARELLLTTWAEETSDDRAALIALMQYGLSMDDEAFLDAALDDRRKEVRRGAIDLLARLPESRLVLGITEHVRPLVHFTPGQPARLFPPSLKRPATLTVTLPEVFPHEFKRWGIEEKPPQHATYGQKAWWLRQLLALVPPATWSTLWQVAPNEAITVAYDGEWAHVLVASWQEAAERQRDTAWAKALLNQWFSRREPKQSSYDYEPWRGIMHVLPAQEQQAIMLAALGQRSATTKKYAALSLLQYVQHPWSDALSRGVLDYLRHEFIPNLPQYEWQYRSIIPQFALYIPPALLAEVSTGWPTAHKNWPHWSEVIDAMIHTLSFRAAIHAAIKGS